MGRLEGRSPRPENPPTRQGWSDSSPRPLNPIHSGDRIAYLRSNLIYRLKGGGSVAHTAGVIDGFLEEGCAVDFYGAESMPLVDQARTPHFLINPSRLYNFVYPVRPYGYTDVWLRKMPQLLKQRPPKALYHRYDTSSLVLRPLADAAQCPAILEYNGSELWVLKNWADNVSVADRLLWKTNWDIETANLVSSDLVVVVSDVIREECIERGVSPQRVLVNPNGVDAKRFEPTWEWNEQERRARRQRLGIPPNRILVSFVGTFGTWHGTQALAHAAAPAAARREDLHFLFVGRGQHYTKVCEIIKNSGMSEKTTMAGSVSPESIAETLAVSDILVSPHIPNPDGTRFFGSPTKLFEYMASGRAIIASRLEQIGEILKHDQTAILVEPGNVQQLSDAIVELAADPQRRARLGEAARRDVLDNYTWTRHVHKIIDALNALT